jgi:hypothetical protein
MFRILTHELTSQGLFIYVEMLRAVSVRSSKVEAHAGQPESDELALTHAMSGACQLFLGSGPISLIFRSAFSLALASKWYLTEKGARQTRDKVLIKRLRDIPVEMDNQDRSGAP